MKRMGKVVVAGLIILLPGCSQGAPRSVKAAASPSSAKSPVNCETASQAEWLKNCAGKDPTTRDVESEPTIEATPLGRPFDYVNTNDSDPLTWKVTLTKAECGLKSIPEAENNPKWDGGTEFPQYIAAKPKKGKDFCIFYWSWNNIGKVHGTPDKSGDVMIGDERHSRSQEDEMMSWTVMDTKLGVGYTDDVNPGESTKSLDIYQVPAGMMPEAVWFPMTTMISESTLLISTK
jgi:hypothetical protein